MRASRAPSLARRRDPEGRPRALDPRSPARRRRVVASSRVVVPSRRVASRAPQSQFGLAGGGAHVASIASDSVAPSRTHASMNARPRVLTRPRSVVDPRSRVDAFERGRGRACTMRVNPSIDVFTIHVSVFTIHVNPSIDRSTPLDAGRRRIRRRRRPTTTTTDDDRRRRRIETTRARRRARRIETTRARARGASGSGRSNRFVRACV